MSTLTKAIYRFNAIPIEIPTVFLAEIEKAFQKFTQTLKVLQIAKTILRGKKEFTFPDFNTNYKAIVMKTV